MIETGESAVSPAGRSAMSCFMPRLRSRQAVRDVVSAWASHAGAHYRPGESQVKQLSMLADVRLEVLYWLP